MKTLACSLLYLALHFQTSAQSVPVQVMVDIYTGEQDKNQIIDTLYEHGLIYGDYKDTLLRLSNKTSLTDSDFVLFEMFLDNRAIEYRVCKKSIYDAWNKELKSIGFLHLGSKKEDDAVTDLYAYYDLRVAITSNPTERFLKYKLFIYRR